MQAHLFSRVIPKFGAKMEPRGTRNGPNLILIMYSNSALSKTLLMADSTKLNEFHKTGEKTPPLSDIVIVSAFWAIFDVFKNVAKTPYFAVKFDEKYIGDVVEPIQSAFSNYAQKWNTMHPERILAKL